MAWIYILENKINGKMYVGQTVQKPEKRFYQHIKNKEKYGSIITKALNKYGIDNFNKYVFECDEEDLDYFERGFIRQMNTKNPYGYNMDDGGNKNKHLSEETKQKLRESHIGCESYWKNKKLPPDMIKKMIDSKVGKYCGENSPFHGMKYSKERCDNISKSLKGKYKGENSPIYGIKRSKESIEKGQVKRRGIFHHTPESIEKIRKASTGRKHTQEEIEKIRRANTGVVFTEERKQKIREKAIGRKRSKK